jgi:hypothetical protein
LIIREVRDVLQVESGGFQGLFDITSSLSDCLVIDLLEKGLGLSFSSAYSPTGIESLLLIRHLDNWVDLAIVVAELQLVPCLTKVNELTR